MNGCEKELKDAATVPNGVTAFVLCPANDPKTTCFSLFEGIDAAGITLNERISKDDLDAVRRFSTAPMHYLCPQSVLDGEKYLV
jgi:hypothetical protein